MSTLEQINPAEAIVGTNVRTAVTLDPRFLASIRERGVLVPVVGYRDDAGQFVVLYGQRRTLAAAQTKRESIPAYIVDGQDEADRLIDQMAENDHRAALTTAERTAGFEQLAALGLSAATIAERTATAKADVAASLTIARSDAAKAAIEAAPTLTLEQAATLAEFDDNPEDVAVLVEAADDGDFAYAAQQIRDRRARAAISATKVEELTAAGVRVIEAPEWGDDTAKPLRRLAPANSTSDDAGADDEAEAEGAVYDEQTHAECPGHVAYVRVSVGWERDKDGKSHRTIEAEATYACDQWAQAGHVDTYASTSASSGQAKKRAEDMTDDERDEAKAARRDVIESNKAWESAEPVRRAWLAEFVQRKTAPKDAPAFLAHAITRHDYVVADRDADALATEWFSLTRAAYGGRATDWADTINKASQPRATMLAVARVLSAMENHTGRDTWRNPAEVDVEYLTTLQRWGYSLSPIEKRAARLDDDSTD